MIPKNSPAKFNENLLHIVSPELLRWVRNKMIAQYRGSGYSLVSHCDEVGIIAEQIARVLFQGSSDLEKKAAKAFLAGSLHDYGKIIIPEKIRLANHFFTSEERRIMEYHVLFGKNLLESLGFPQEVVDAAYFHHLNYSGGGYPKCTLTKEEIPLMARIVAVADQFSARTENRPHRPGHSPMEVWAELQHLRGRVFDPDVLDAFAETEFLKLALTKHYYSLSTCG